MATRVVQTRAELLEAVAAGEQDVAVRGAIDDVPSLRLAPGRSLRGDGSATIAFAAGSEGLRLTADNQVERIALLADAARQAIFNDGASESLGRLAILDVRTTGVVRLLATEAASGGDVKVAGLRIVSADARAFLPRPSGFGVDVIAGVFTLWNRSEDPDHRITATIDDLSLGAPDAPVLGSGVFVGGTPGGGEVLVSRLETGEIHSRGGIAEGTAGQISGGVFVLHGARVREVRNRGAVTTYGPNDMVLDNWGSVERWDALAPISSRGPNGIGFVNFGELGALDIRAAIETHGLGARGFNVYAGTVGRATFDRIVTRADGAVGIQLSRPIGVLRVRGGIETFGGFGGSLVKGVITRLPAIPLSLRPGATADAIMIEGGLVSHGKGVDALELHGAVGDLAIRGGLRATGGDGE